MLRSTSLSPSSASYQPDNLNTLPAGLYGLEDVLTLSRRHQSRDGFIYIPTNYNHMDPLPTLFFLHGKGGSGGQVASALARVAEELGFILVAPDSRGETWDLMRDEANHSDSLFLFEVYERLHQRFKTHPHFTAIGGFSYGAGAAIDFGLTSAAQFTHVLAIAPNYVPPRIMMNHPKIYLSHGRNDSVLNIDRTSRKIYEGLKERGLSIDFSENDGGHGLLPTSVKNALIWWLKSGSAKELDVEALDTRSQGFERT